jgi:hypothetical protein
MALSINTLILQFPRDKNPKMDLETVHRLEELIHQGLFQNRSGSVDGHDWGHSGANIFVHPAKGQSWPSVDVVKAYLQRQGLLGSCLIVKRYKSERYEVIWPEHYDGEFERL